MTADPAGFPFKPGPESGGGSISPAEDPSLRQLLLRYIARSLPEPESFELRLLEDDEFAAKIDLAEQDVLEDYAAGTLGQALPADVLRLVEAWIDASAVRRDHVRVTRLLLERPAAKQQDARAVRVAGRVYWPWLWTAAAACLLLGLMLPRIRMRSAHPTATSMTAVAPPTRPAKAPAADVILLAAERLRAAGSPAGPAYTIHRDTPVRLQVVLPEGSPGLEYTLSIRHAHSPGALARFAGLAAKRESGTLYVEATLAPGTLAPGAYVVSIGSSHGAVDLPLRVVSP